MQLRCSKHCNLYIILKTNQIACISLRTRKRERENKTTFHQYVAFNFFGNNPKKIFSTTSHVSSLKRHCTFRLFVNVIIFSPMYTFHKIHPYLISIYAGSFSFILRLLIVDVTRTSNSYNPIPS